MATPKKDLRSSRTRDLGSSSAQGGKPGRALLLILLIAAVLTAGMFASGERTPRLGIDLAGGTSITLSATDDSRNENAVNPTNLQTAASVIERRVNGLGVSEAEVQTQGDRNIIVSIPRGTNEAQAREQVGTTAQLGFRPVLSATLAQQPPQGGQGEGGEDSGAEGGSQDGEGTGESPGEDSPDQQSPAEDESPPEEPSEDQESPGGGTSDQSLSSLDGTPSGLSPAGGVTDVTQSSRAADDDGETGGPAQDGQGGAEEAGADAGNGAAGEEGAAGEGGAGSSADVTAQLAALDCSTPQARAQAAGRAAQFEDDESVVACGQDGFYKYALGPVAVPGTDIGDASAVYDSQRGQGWIVQMDFNRAGAGKFADITAQLAQQAEPRNQFAIVLDGSVVSAPRVSERLGGGRAEISGGFTQETSEDLANILKYGALPITFEEANVTTVSPTLGTEQLRAGLIAGAIGLALVMVYLVMYYRGLAFIAVSSLVTMAGLTYVIMTLLGPAIGFALSLPAVCGAIVSIGITADSFIVYFERIRDEVREGRSVRPAIERAWPRARRTILVSDMVSFIAAVVLFVVSVGSVQGFAFVLGLTTALDVLVVLLLTKPLMTLLARRKFFASGHAWSGLDPQRLGARAPFRRAGRGRTTVPAEAKEA